MTKYYKAVREDYTDFYTGKIDYSVGNTVKHPEPGPWGDSEANGYLSVTTDPTDIPGLACWPLRLLEVEIKKGWKSTVHSNKVCTHKIKVVGEVEAWQYFGDHGERILRMVDQVNSLNPEDKDRLLYTIEKVRGGAAYRNLRYMVVYTLGDRPSAYNILNLVPGDEMLHSVIEGVAVEDLLEHNLRDYVWELTPTWDKFFEASTPVETFWSRVKHFFKTF